MSHLIFDLDDTLIASFPQYVRMHQDIARHLGLRVPSRTELVPYAASWEATLARLWPGQDLEPFFARYEETADDYPYPAIPDAAPTLARLRAAGYALWIVTKRTRRRLAQRMGQAGLPASLFAGVFPAEDQPAVKPDPRCFEPVWRAAGGRPTEVVFVGDRHEDRQAAEAAGVPFVAVLSGPESEHGFPGDLAPERVLSSVAALPAWLGL